LASRRISPATNGVNPRAVARLDFDGSIGSLSVVAQDSLSCDITSANGLSIEIEADSLVQLSSSASRIGYTYSSLLSAPPWARGKDGGFYWNDGNGGSTHYMHPQHPGTYQAVGGGTGVPDTFHIDLDAGQGSAFGVFPTRPFDFEKLYGAGARPFVCHLYDYGTIHPGNLLRQRVEWFKDHGFGVYCFFNTVYLDDPDGSRSDILDLQPGYEYWPIYNTVTERWEYLFADPDKIREFVTFAHTHGFKVAVYFYPHQWQEVTGTPLSAALPWMRDFQAQFDLDGWYLDGLTDRTYGDWLQTYKFVRQLRADVGEDGFLWFHNSLDPWGKWDGRVLVHAETYADATFKGETGDFAVLQSPRDAYHRYYNSGYGMSQVIGIQYRKSSGTPRGAITMDERSRTMASLFGGARVASTLTDDFEQFFWPYYVANRQRYVEGTLLDAFPSALDWFQDISVVVSGVTADGATISWSTPEPTVAEVRYLAEQPEYGYCFDDTVLTSAGYVPVPFLLRQITAPATQHSITLAGCAAGTTYYVRVRSSAASAASEPYNPNADRLYGGFVSFHTAEN
jgi:hypothetical protein